MTILQINLWTCEICQAVEFTANEVSPYSDPVVESPGETEWDYVAHEGSERLACPSCLKEHLKGG